jgi:hypothetical protein
MEALHVLQCSRTTKGGDPEASRLALEVAVRPLVFTGTKPYVGAVYLGRIVCFEDAAGRLGASDAVRAALISRLVMTRHWQV